MRTATIERESVNLEGFLNALAEIFAFQGKSVEVLILAESKPVLSWLYEDFGIDNYCLQLLIPRNFFSQIVENREDLEKSIFDEGAQIYGVGSNEGLGKVRILPDTSVPDAGWRDRAKSWVTGEGVTNQGRVRSDNKAPKQFEGLLFRSVSEIHLFTALKQMGVPFAPLPVFIKGGQSYQRIEPDFIIIKDGLILHVEVDGDSFHRESPADADRRTSVLRHEGARIERVSASDCDSAEKAQACAKKLLEILAKLKRSSAC